MAPPMRETRGHFRPKYRNARGSIAGIGHFDVPHAWQMLVLSVESYFFGSRDSIFVHWIPNGHHLWLIEIRFPSNARAYKIMRTNAPPIEHNLHNHLNVCKFFSLNVVGKLATSCTAPSRTIHIHDLTETKLSRRLKWICREKFARIFSKTCIWRQRRSSTLVWCTDPSRARANLCSTKVSPHSIPFIPGVS